MSAIDKSRIVAVIGAGTMGAGIAQVAAAAGHPVLLYDAAQGAAATGRTRLASGLQGLVAKGKLDAGELESLLGRITVAENLDALAPAALVIEAIIERLDMKQKVLGDVEKLVSSDTILATNTSSISITAIAAKLAAPERVVGMHFFNPAPVMKLVEVVSGMATSPEVTESILDTATAWGKVAVRAKSTPGFIVNRVARAFYGEPLRLFEEGVADAATIDALMVQGGGFRMGPFALMDLIGHDVNYAVSSSVFEAYHYEPRFRPSQTQAELVAAGWLGRKTDRGFYDYRPGAIALQPATALAPSGTPAWEHLGLTDIEGRAGIDIALTDGRRACERADVSGTPTIVHDLVARDSGQSGRVGFACSPQVSEAQRSAFVATLASQGMSATELPDWPGLVVLRTLALIANEAFEAVLQGVADEADVDNAMRFGVNYPSGPIAWVRRVGLQRILRILDELREKTGDPRYRASLGLRYAAGTALQATI